MKSVAILGATGSIGQNTIDLIAPDADAYVVEALTGARNLDAFIAGEIGFLQMAQGVDRTLDMMSSGDGLQNANLDLDTVLDTDRLARIRAGQIINSLR